MYCLMYMFSLRSINIFYVLINGMDLIIFKNCNEVYLLIGFFRCIVEKRFLFCNVYINRFG